MYTQREKQQSLNGVWKFNPDPYMRCRQQNWWLGEGGKNAFFPCFNYDGLWDINVPATWKKEFEKLEWYDGHVNYVLDFECENIPENHEAFLCFDQVIYHCDVYLNGQNVGSHQWGYSPFQLNVTGLLGKKNRLFVLVENFMKEDRVPGIRCDWNNDGGITGEVKIVFVPRTYVENFHVQTTLTEDKVELHNKILIAGKDKSKTAEVTFEIEELGIKETHQIPTSTNYSFTHSIIKDKVDLWCPENTKLYDVKIHCEGEVVHDQIGLREIKTQGTQMLLNGKELRLTGVAVHSEFPETGRVATDEGIELMLKKARELGCNFLRCAHYPYQDKFARAMDKAGMLWWEEVPVYWLPEIHKEPLCSKALGMLEEAIDRDWNRASLIIWSVSNECAGDGLGATKALTLKDGNYPYWVKACKLIRDKDPGRLISSADAGHRKTKNSKWTPDAGDAFDHDPDADVFLPGHPDEFYDLLDVLGANLYVSVKGANPATTDKWVDMLRPFNKPLMLTEFGSMSTTEDDANRSPDEVGHPEYHEAILREGYQACHQHPEIVGVVPWALMDVRVPMHWRWYNRGSGTFAYGFLDNQYKEKRVYNVVKDEIASLRKAWKM